MTGAGAARSLADRPDIVAEIDPAKHPGIDPRAIPAGSLLRINWRCKKGHSWEATVSIRVRRGTGCPQCAGMATTDGMRSASRLALEAAEAESAGFRLVPSRRSLARLARDYSYGQDELFIIERVAPAVRKRGHFTRAELIDVCRWKTPRSVPRVAENTEDGVTELTRTALAAEHEELRVAPLIYLAGVDWATASVLLHFAHVDRYPIIDFRALEALGVPRKETRYYTMGFWLGYVLATRRLADETGLTMRELDRALWQWSKEQGA
jgi:hypothetical protein